MNDNFHYTLQLLSNLSFCHNVCTEALLDFWCLSHFVAKEEINCLIILLLTKDSFYIFDSIIFSTSSAVDLLYMQYRFNPFPHTTILQQTTLNIFCQQIENLYNWMNNLRLKVENIVAKGEIARIEQFLLFHYVFKKLSAAEASGSVYMRERFKYWHVCFHQEN